MKNNFVLFTAGEFSKFHGLNKRTLHYYDSAGIFSPKNKGDNGYRYYTYEQSMELQNILTVLPAGKYVRAFSIGDWDKIPSLYNEVFLFTKKMD